MRMSQHQQVWPQAPDGWTLGRPGDFPRHCNTEDDHAWDVMVDSRRKRRMAIGLECSVNTRDHTVPQMYLKRFAAKNGKGHLLQVRPVEDLSRVHPSTVRDVSVVNGFYWGTTPEGIPHHYMEKLLGRIESGATNAFSWMLDDHDFVLPRRWPMPGADRVWVALWVAAQLLRTTRQRRRLEYLAAGDHEVMDLPRAVKELKSDRHLAFIISELEGLMTVLYHRPWCLAFTAACQWTSDAPVLLLNGQDQPNVQLAAAFWDVVVPLDPHRVLILPGVGTTTSDPRSQRDHLATIDGGLGLILAQAIYDAADAYLFNHPDHDPHTVSRIERSGRVPAPWAGDDPALLGPSYTIAYELLPPGVTVERRWLSEHPPHSR